MDRRWRDKRQKRRSLANISAILGDAANYRPHIGLQFRNEIHFPGQVALMAAEWFLRRHKFLRPSSWFLASRGPGISGRIPFRYPGINSNREIFPPFSAVCTSMQVLQKESFLSMDRKVTVSLLGPTLFRGFSRMIAEFSQFLNELLVNCEWKRYSRYKKNRFELRTEKLSFFFLVRRCFVGFHV